MNGLSVMPCVQQVQAVSGRRYGDYAVKAVSGPGCREMIRISGNRGGSADAVLTDRAWNRTGHSQDFPVRSEVKRDTGKKLKRPGHSRPVPFLLRVLVLAVLFAVMIAGFQTMTGASSRRQEQKYKYYTTITLGYGEDITDIVYRYCDSSRYSAPEEYVMEICEINGLPCRRGELPDLPAGTKIVIPYYDTEIK